VPSSALQRRRNRAIFGRKKAEYNGARTLFKALMKPCKKTLVQQLTKASTSIHRFHTKPQPESFILKVAQHLLNWKSGGAFEISIEFSKKQTFH